MSWPCAEPTGRANARPMTGSFIASGAMLSKPSFRGDAKHRTRNLEIPGLLLTHHPGMTLTLSPRVKNKAGDDEHCRHRQHLRKHFRGRPFGGFLHAVLPRLGRESSLPAKARWLDYFLLGTPRDEYSLDLIIVPTQRISTMRRSNSIAAAI
jgi:hypothetical protein